MFENTAIFHKHLYQLNALPAMYDESVLELLDQRPVLDENSTLPKDDKIHAAHSNSGYGNSRHGNSRIFLQVYKAVVKCPKTFALLKSVILDFWSTEIPPRE